MRRPSSLALFLALALGAGAAAADVHAPVDAGAAFVDELSERVPGADAIDGRIRAPCCWNQTIDIHGSEVALELRREIRRRLRSGESADAIQASFVARYGERILAVPPGSPIKSVGVGLLAVIAGAGVGGFFMLKRWRRRSEASESAAAKKAKKNPRAADEKLDERLDAELRAFDEG